jgi:hypothetical protein
LAGLEQVLGPESVPELKLGPESVLALQEQEPRPVLKLELRPVSELKPRPVSELRFFESQLALERVQLLYWEPGLGRVQ